MDPNLFALLVIAILVIVLFVLFRQYVEVEFSITPPRFKAKGRNQEKLGTQIRRIRSKSGGVEVEDRTGKGVELEDVNSEKSIRVSHYFQDQPKDPKV